MVGVIAACALGLVTPPAATASEQSMHIAVGDIPGVDQLNLLVAVHQAGERGVKIEVSYLQSEDIVARAVVSRQADIGIGTPYGMIQKATAPIRMFYQLSKLRFFPVVNTEYYKTWKDLEGVNVYVHSPGSGTEAIMNLMAKRNGIKYKAMKYLPGSAVRAKALLAGRVKATIVDSKRRTLVLREGGGKFAQLPMPDINASDEALYANVDFLKNRSGAIDILLGELIKVWREINDNPAAILDMRKNYDLLPNLPPQDLDGLLLYYQENVNNGTFPNNGGGVEAVKEDFEFYGFAGAIKGDIGRLNVEDFWYLAPLNKALDNLGRM